MASVFLSYDHDDADRVAPIASALEKAGHSVWWDRHIHGGAEYNSEIESAVDRSDLVVVLWSEKSVRSAWVRDEAAEGRDQGKLVPALLDPVKPPMGFRQYQTVDLSGGKKRVGDRPFGELLRAVARIGDPAASRPQPEPAPPRALRTSPTLLAGGAIILLIAVAMFFWRPWESRSPVPSVTVEANDQSARSRALAGNLLVQLGSLQAAKADALSLVEPGSAAKADMTFKVADTGATGDLRASLSLIESRGNTLLWSREFVQPSGNEADLRQQLAYSAGQVLRCATEALAPDHPELELATLKLYLGGCAELSTTIVDPATSIPLFRKVTRQAPRFAGGWAKLIVAELDAFKGTNATNSALQSQLRADIEEARKLEPDMAEIYLVQSWLQEPRPILGWMKFADQAVAKNPDHARTLENHALGMLHVGRMRRAVQDARRAVQAEPLSSGARQIFINTLMDSGAIEAARKELLEAERLWPGATNVLQTRLRLEFYYGDAREALRLLESRQLGSTPSQAQKSYLKARIEPTPANVERAIADARAVYRHEMSISPLSNALATFGRTDELTDTLLSSDPGAAPGLILAFFRPPFAALRKDRRFMKIAERYGLIDYWRDSGHWPDFCFEPDVPYDCKAEAAKVAA